MKSCILIAITLCLFGCSNEGPNPVGERTPDSTVRLAGIAGVGSYWKNGVHTALSNASQVFSMSVDGSLVLIGGSLTGGQDVIWQNGEETPVDGGPGGVTLVASRDNNIFGVWATTGGWVIYKNGTTTPISRTGWPTAMALLGDDVYIAGTSQGNDHPWGTAFYPLDTYAQCWKNGQVIFRDSVHTYATSIFIHQDDIYMGGHLNHYPSLDRIACYWKNGQRFKLTEENQDAEVTSLFVTDTHVYAAGMINDEAVYWKDGDVINLSTSVANSIAYSISVLGTDVYVAGREDKYPAVWKNGLKQIIPNQDKQGEIKAVVAVSN